MMNRLKSVIFLCCVSLLTGILPVGLLLQAAAGDSIPDSMLLGDVNGDRSFDVRDLVHYKKYCAAPESISDFIGEAADCDGDGEISVKDVISVRKLLLSDEAVRLWRTSFFDDDGNLLQTSYVRQNTSPVLKAVPQKSRDPQYTYCFGGWSDGEEIYQTNALPAVSGAVSYRAVYEKNYNVYQAKGSGAAAGYPRLLQLSNGNYFLTADTKYAVSSDGINFGSYTSFLTDELKYDPVTGKADLACANAQPMLLGDGRVAVFFRASNADIGYSSIRMIVGNKYGKNFGNPVTLMENYDSALSGGGIWEPYGIILKDGTLAVYVSCDIRGTEAYGSIPAHENLVCPRNETTKTTRQNILLITLAEEKGSFVPSKPCIVSDGVAHDSRDGMSVIAQLADGSYAMVIEATSERDQYAFVIQMLYSQDGYTWTEPQTIIRPQKTGNNCAAPYITALPDGRIAVSCCTTEGYRGYRPGSGSGYKVQRVFISKDPVSYGSPDIEFEELIYREYPENEYSIFGGVSYINGRLYMFSGSGINDENGKSTSKEALLYYILYQYPVAGEDYGTWTDDIIL